MRGAAVRVRRLGGRGFSAVNHLEEGAEEKRPVGKKKKLSAETKSNFYNLQLAWGFVLVVFF